MRIRIDLLSTPLAVAAMLLTSPLAGCKKPEYPKCKKDKHCKVDEGEKCVDGLCQNCTTDEDCKGKGPQGQDFKCHEFRCTDPTQISPAGGTGGLGAPCTQTIDCAGGLVCKAGKCDKCTDDVECQPGTCDEATGTCTVAGGGQCTTDDQCPMDQICDNGTCVASGYTAGANPCSLDAVYFEFDSPQLKPDAQQALQAAADCIKQQSRNVILEAHADQRGTEEYNIMLTDRRGQSVKQFLENLGVSGSKMQVMAKGDLEATGTDDASMAKDRRVQFVWP